MHSLKTKSQRIVRPQQLVDTVITQLRKEITSERYKVGDKFPTETELMDRFGISRNTLREAVRALTSTGMLTVQQGRGTFIRSVSSGVESFEGRLQRADVEEIFEVRRVLEVEIARLAALKRTEENLCILRELLEKRTEAHLQQHVQNCIRYDILFHTAMAKASGNSLLEDMYRAFSKALEQLLSEMKKYATGMDYGVILNSHQRLLRAVETQNAKEAEDCARSYIDSTQKYIEE